MRCNATHVQHNCNGEKEIEIESEVDTDLEKKSKTVHATDLKML